jgi:predicted peptidase
MHMKIAKLISIFVVLVFFCLPAVSCRKKVLTGPYPARTASEIVKWADSKGQQLPLYLPVQPAGASVPIVMYLHYYTGDPINSQPWIITSLNQYEPCAVFLPYRPSSEGASAWGGTYDASLRPAMVDTLAELDAFIPAYNFNINRQYLFGESMGAEGVLKLLVEYPTRFAGAVSVAGYTADTGAAAFAQEMKKTPLWLIWGAADTSLNTQDWNIYNLIVAAGGTHVKQTEYAGLGHNESISAAASEPGLCAWLLAQHHP